MERGQVPPRAHGRARVASSHARPPRLNPPVPDKGIQARSSSQELEHPRPHGVDDQDGGVRRLLEDCSR